MSNSLVVSFGRASGIAPACLAAQNANGLCGRGFRPNQLQLLRGWNSGRVYNRNVTVIDRGKAQDFIDLKNEVIHSPEHYASLYLDGLPTR
jgi:hypothetical protein